jgi:hypothetical protein
LRGINELNARGLRGLNGGISLDAIVADEIVSRNEIITDIGLLKDRRYYRAAFDWDG